MKNYSTCNSTNKHTSDTGLANKTVFLPTHADMSCTNKSYETAIENEKCKLGQELHDGVNPLLAAALLYLKLIKPVSKRGVKIKETIQTILMESIGCIRNITSDMVIAEKKQFKLKELLESYTERLRCIVEFSIVIEIDDNEFLNKLKDLEKINLYRIIQEQMNNIIKYSKAENVRIKFKKEPAGLLLTIQDDGIGFDNTLPKNGIGLQNMKNRMEDLHGTINIESSPGKGCTIYAFLPLPDENRLVSLYSY